MTEAMSKKERLARGSAVIKVMKVIPRPGKYLKSFADVHKMPRKPKPAYLKGPAAEMPHLDVKHALFDFRPDSAKVMPEQVVPEDGSGDPCAIPSDDIDPKTAGFPDGDKMLAWYGYREWANDCNPPRDYNIAEHFNIMLGLLISMSEDPENQNFADAEAYPCVQFLRSIKTPDGVWPTNVASFILYLEYVCQKMIDEG